MGVTAKAGIEFRKIGDEGVLLDSGTGTFYRLSSKATILWENLITHGMADGDPATIEQMERAGLILHGASLASEEVDYSDDRDIVQTPAFLVFTPCSTNTSQRACISSKQGGVTCAWDVNRTPKCYKP